MKCFAYSRRQSFSSPMCLDWLWFTFRNSLTFLLEGRSEREVYISLFKWRVSQLRSSVAWSLIKQGETLISLIKTNIPLETRPILKHPGKTQTKPSCGQDSSQSGKVHVRSRQRTHANTSTKTRKLLPSDEISHDISSSQVFSILHSSHFLFSLRPTFPLHNADEMAKWQTNCVSDDHFAGCTGPQQ